MELFQHTEGSEDPEIVVVETTAVVRTLLLPTNPDHGVWIEEVDEEIDLDLTFEAAGIHHHHHVHRGRCRRVKVVIQFNADDFTHEYGPATTIKTVYHWASGDKAANLFPEQRAKYVLAVPAPTTSLPMASTSARYWWPAGPARSLSTCCPGTASPGDRHRGRSRRARRACLP